ncbi:MAG: hypothetical protein HeimC3_12960 [Candidatus Heimdallarchaeota archaeon LC_3]|nr:MAG: hypothetical protein HeimC3_15990 [Candidatus Heimdallarchaeota archaeon LC_3]OLS26022.1 MAG: hypothetical protein HeimC3_12960 [Candidatus Heimdallarchaeota archaeon LC_3]
MIPEDLLIFFENTTNKSEIQSLFQKSNCYLSNEERWTMLCLLLHSFGASYDFSKHELYLHWSVKDKDHLKYIQQLINNILDSNIVAEYDNKNQTWILKF